MADSEDKTEEPSAKRLSESRERGQVLQSRDITHLFMMGTGTIVVLILGPLLMGRVLVLARAFLERPHEMRIATEEMVDIASEVLQALAVALALPMILLIAAAVASAYVQFGFLWSTEKIAPDLERINPISGFKRLFSLQSVFETAKSLVKLAIIGAVAFFMISPFIPGSENLAGMAAQDTLLVLRQMAAKLLIGVLAMIAVIAAADYAYQRWEFMKKMRMSKQEVKDEMKQAEGDPIIKSRLRRLRMEKSRRRMMSAVPTATVVVTNPTHFAVALKYEKTMRAPVVVAKGADLIAFKIRELARENQVPVVENAPLARMLHATVEIDEEILPDQYKAVAEVISYVMKLRSSAVGANPVGAPIR